MLMKDDCQIFSQREIKAALRDWRHHQNRVWDCLLQLMTIDVDAANKENKWKYAQEIYELRRKALYDHKTLEKLQLQVNKYQVGKILYQLLQLEMKRPDTYLTITRALRKINIRDRAIIYYHYAYGYDGEELAQKYSLDPEKIAMILDKATTTIATCLADDVQ